MPTGPKKSRWRRILFFSLMALLVLAPLVLYQVLTSPRFLHWAVGKLNHIIPGQIVYEDLQFNLTQGELKARQLKYLNEEDVPVISLARMDMDFYWLSIFAGKLEIKQLKIDDFTVDAGKFPKREKPSQWRKALQIISKRLSIEKSLITPIQIIFKNGDTLRLEGLGIELTRQILGEQQIHLDLVRSEFDKAEKKFSTGALNFSGSVDIPALEEFNFFVEDAQGSLKIVDIDVPNLSDGSLQTEFSIDGNTVILKEGQLNIPQGTLLVDLEMDSEDDSFKLELKNDVPIPFAAIPRASKNLTNTLSTFKMDLKADMKGTSLKELSGSVELELDAKGVQGPEKFPDAHLSLKGKMKNGALDLGHFEITSDKTKLKATGTVDFAKQNFNAKVNTTNFNVTMLVNALAEIDLKGMADAEGTVTGPFRKPNFNLKATARESGYSFLSFGEIQGLFKIEDGTLDFEGGSAPGSEAFTKVKVVVQDIYDKTRKTRLNSEFRNLEAGKLLAKEEDYKGKVTGTFDMEASGGKESGKLQARIENLSLFGFSFDYLDTKGEMSDNRFVLNPVLYQPVKYETLTMPEPITFGFDDRGWTVKGTLLQGAAMEGKYLKSQPTKVDLNVALKNTDLRPILAAWGVPARESYADGKVEMHLGIDEHPTAIDIRLSRLEIPLEEEETVLKNDGEIIIAMRPPRVEFKQARFIHGDSHFQIAGYYMMEGASSALSLTGEVALVILPLLTPKYFREGEGKAKMDLKMSGTTDNPQITGDLTFENASITLRPIRAHVENLNGSLKFTPNTITFNKLRGTMREGDLAVDGEIKLHDLKPTAYDLKIATREVAISEPGVYKIIFSGDFLLKGPAGNAVLSGIMDINEGVYSRDFNLTQTFLRAQTPTVREEPSELLKDIVLDLVIRSPGELAVKNNIARIFFKSDLRVTGPATQPKVSGALAVLDGEFHYFTVDFQGATGLIDFRDPKRGPYVNVDLTKNYASSFTDITALVHIEGFTDNLQLTFSSNPPLERRDLMALVFTGVLPGEARRNLSGTNLASTVIASQLSQVIQKPLAKTAQLDIFRLEATDPDQTSAISTLVVGKRLTDRLSLEFKTDLGVDKPLQGVQMEYLLIDNVLIKATQFSDGAFDFNLAFRILLF